MNLFDIPCIYLCYGFLYLFSPNLLGRRPTTLQDRTRDSDDDDYQDRDYDVAALANNLSQAFKYGIYSNDAIAEVCFSAYLVDLFLYTVWLEKKYS